MLYEIILKGLKIHMRDVVKASRPGNGEGKLFVSTAYKWKT